MLKSFVSTHNMACLEPAKKQELRSQSLIKKRSPIALHTKNLNCLRCRLLFVIYCNHFSLLHVPFLFQVFLFKITAMGKASVGHKSWGAAINYFAPQTFGRPTIFPTRDATLFRIWRRAQAHKN